MGNWKRWTLPPLALLLLLFCAGCASSKAEEIVDIGMEEMQAARPGPDGAGDRGDGAREAAPAGGGERPQMPMASSGRIQAARQAAYAQVGEVEEVVGNEVTLLLQKERGGAYEPTGETAAYLIPVGMPVGSGDYSSVRKGMLLGFSAEGDRMTSVTLLRG